MPRSPLALLLCTVLATASACGETSNAGPTAPAANSSSDAGVATPSVASAVTGYHDTLQKHVDAAGWVDYAALSDDRAALDAYAASVGPAGVLSGLDDDQRLASLINAYNAFTLQLILDHYDNGKLKSITDLHGGKPWDQKLWQLNGQTLSLNHLEHEIIRKEFDEPRIHWALVCAAYSCPPLRSETYTPALLDTQLAQQEAYVLNFDHPRFTRKTNGSIAVTKLFEWYGGDFGDWKNYAKAKLGLPGSPKFTFLDYDWRLNDVKNKP